MSENMAPSHTPTPELIHVYKRWAEGGAGLIITGNIMIDKDAIGEPGNVIVDDRRNLDQLQKWANTIAGTGAHLWGQLNHPGRQAMVGISKKIVAPSAIALKMKGLSVMFRAPKALDENEILDIIDRFGNSALILKEAGFNGVQIHGAHGYLVSQFLSPLANQRTDQWGGSLENRARFVLAIYKNIRAKVGPAFPIGIKINSADFQRGGFTEEESMKVVKMLDEAGMDLIEISGGTYEQAEMMGATKRKSTLEREAFFMDYVEKARELIKTPLMLTGGFRTVSTMEEAVAENKLDIIGLARPFTLHPDFPKQIFNGSIQQLKVPIPKTGISQLDQSGFVDVIWHEIQIRRLGEGKAPKPSMSAYAVVWENMSTVMKMLVPKLPFAKKRPRRGIAVS